MANLKTGKTSVPTTTEKKGSTKLLSSKAELQLLLNKYEPQIAKALPSVLTPERFSRMCMTALSTTPKLCACTPQSFLGAILNAAQLGVEPNTPLGEAYLIPYNNKKKGVTECQFQLGYKGLMSLAWRSGEIISIEAHEVKEKDFFEYEYGLDAKCKHVPARGDRGKTIYYYAIYKTKNGGYGFEVASREDIYDFARLKSQAFNNGPWQTDFDAMAKKTVLKAALKYAPLKSEFLRAVSTDETIKNGIASDMSLLPDETPFDEPPTIDAEATDGNVPGGNEAETVAEMPQDEMVDFDGSMFPDAGQQ